MTPHRRRTAVVSLLLAVVLALASVVASAAGADASTRTEPLRATFENLSPGSTASASWGLELRRAAVVTEVTAVEAGPGGVEWDVRLCARATGTCTPVTDGATGARLAAGAYDLRVAVAATPDLPPAATTTLDGRIVLADADAADAVAPGGRAPGDAPLAMTGLPALSLLLAALATALVGLLLLLGARRRRADEAAVPVPVPAPVPVPDPERRP